MTRLKKFKYEQYLSMFEDVMDAEYSEKTVTAYRTVIDVPPNEKDQTPLTLRKEDGVLRYETKLTEEKLRHLTYDERKRLVGNIGLSCNDSLEAALESVSKQIAKKIEKGVKAGLEENAIIAEILRYKEDRGRYVIKCNFTPESGQFSEIDKHHFNYQPYDGADMEYYRDKGFDPVEIDYDKIYRDEVRKGNI